MKKTNLILGGFLIIGIVAFVYAATLISQEQVKSCDDGDNGLNFTVASYIKGFDLNNSYALYDYCINNYTVGERTCATVNTTAYRQLWSENCTAINRTLCSDGRCI